MLILYNFSLLNCVYEVFRTLINYLGLFVLRIKPYGYRY